MSQNINTFDENLAVHQQMDDEPNDVGGLSAEELKARFDFAALALQKYLNEVLIPAHNRLGADVDELGRVLRDHTDIDPGNIAAQNVGLLRELADKCGLTDKLAPTVHDALEVLEPLVGPRDQLVKLAPAHVYMEHWWQRRKAASSYPVKIGVPVDVAYSDEAYHIFSSGDFDNEVVITYADSVAVDEMGHAVLVSPKTLSTTGLELRKTEYTKLLGKYVQRLSGYTALGPLFIPEDAVLGYNNGSSRDTIWFENSCDVTIPIPVREWESIHSAERGAYPDAGVKDGYEYRYVGVPLAKVDQGVRVETGFYAGTGTYGANSPNQLTFAFEPQVVIVTCAAELSAGPMVLLRGAVSCALPTETDNGYYRSELAQVTWDGKSVSWYADTDIEQMNDLGVGYNYVAIG